MKKYYVLDSIQRNYHTFSMKEKEIADYVLNHKETILNINIKDLAQKTNASTSTITRFCKKIGVENFVEFKILLNREVEKTNESNDTFELVNHMYNVIIKSTQELVDHEQIKRIIHIMKQTPNILIFGLGSSGLTALELKYRLMRMGFNVDAIIDPHMMLMGSALIQPNSLVFCISNSGTSAEVINAASIAKENGGYVISITNYDHTKLTEVSDEVIFTSSLKIIDQDNFINSQLSIFYILDIVSMLLLEDPAYLEKRKKTLETIHKMRGEQ
ncbi:MurR/RpiR family transcriptional regulator [Bacillus testis]|uniref:MurR/RpiR family transcriptional regulator n=1 Tax=Bacillus testis TaxID=1622072 RepID=UPI00067F31C8|nr:MurR/RpiR family transcriptional regulator [Bacillus testis]